jgi:hypothetical protein
MRLTSREAIGSLQLRRYAHARYGIVETLTKGAVIYVRPVFGLLRPGEEQQLNMARLTRKRRRPTDYALVRACCCRWCRVS